VAPCPAHAQHTNLLLESIYNKSMSVRLGLLSPDHQSLLLVLPTQLGSKPGSQDASGECPRANHSLHTAVVCTNLKL
jgi:hypothetical protein